MNKEVRIRIEYLNGDWEEYLLSKYNDYDVNPGTWIHDNVIEFKYIERDIVEDKIKTKIIPLSAIKHITSI